MRRAGKLCAGILSHFRDIIKPGITTLDLDKIAEEKILSAGCTPAFKGYKDFPNTICASLNDGVVHCKPTNLPLKNGDILTVDIGAIYDGFYADTACTFVVGEVSLEITDLLKSCYGSLFAGIEKAVDGNYVDDISTAIYNYTGVSNYGVVNEFVGHGIGKNLHEDPKISNVPSNANTPLLSNGMVICIEPILTFNKSGNVKDIHSWNVKTEDGSVAVHFEHMVAILPCGPEILTLREEEKGNNHA